MLEPPSANPLALFAALRRAEVIASAATEDQFFDILRELENASPLSGSAAECPFCVLMPPTLDPRAKWLELTGDYGLPRSDGNLLHEGFIPWDRQLAERKSGVDIFEGLGPSPRYVLIDADYGVALLPRGGTIGRFVLDRGLLERLQAVDEYYRRVPASVLSVGAIRAHGVMTGRIPPGASPIEFEVESRAQLTDVLSRIGRQITPYAVQLWFRGQTNDYLLPDLTTAAKAGICPWRHIRDTSLVPRIYRKAADITNDLQGYCRQLHEIDLYTLFMQARLAMRPYTSRQSEERPIEKLSDAWGPYVGGFTVTQRLQSGETVAVRDYHSAFSGLQQSFFLQHYGLPSNVLDMTQDPDVALFFAQHDVVGGRLQPFNERVDQPIIYAFLLMPGMDRFIDSRQLSEHYGLQRPLRQACGLMCGASLISRNYYARFISFKIHIRKRIPGNLTAEYVYPEPKDDRFLKDLLDFADSNGLRQVRPFVPFNA